MENFTRIKIKSLILFLFFVVPIVLASAQSSKPNVIVILADDMGFSDLSSYGSEIQTPELDNLANGGVKFKTFYNTAKCSPTRASLLTGQYPHAAGMENLTTSTGGNSPAYCRSFKNRGVQNLYVGEVACRGKST